MRRGVVGEGGARGRFRYVRKMRVCLRFPLRGSVGSVLFTFMVD